LATLGGWKEQLVFLKDSLTQLLIAAGETSSLSVADVSIAIMRV